MKRNLLGTARITFILVTAFCLMNVGTAAADSPMGWAVVPGYGVESTIGGGNGNVVTATTASQLASYASSSEPLVILVQGTLSGQTINIASNKTIIGVGSNATLNGCELNMSGVSNIIIRNLTIYGATDGIATRFTHHVWIDHCDVSNCGDGLIDITKESDFHTVSWTRFSNHHKTMLINSGTDQPGDIGKLNTTLHHNWWDGSDTRNPRAAYGKIHVFNNLYNNNDYCIGLHSQCRVLVEKNYFINTNDCIHQMYVSDPTSPHYGFAEAVDNVRINCSGDWDDDGISFDVNEYYMYEFALDPASDVQSIVQANVGPAAEYGEIGLMPIPGNGAVNVSTTPTLQWTKGQSATSYIVYFGTSSNPPEVDTTTGQSYSPGALTTGTVYYWAVDQVTPSGTVVGPLWRFVVGEYGGIPDTTPPTPDPMTWEVAPHSIGGVDIAMEATTATDISGVMYYFANLTDPNHDSGWVSSPSWTDANLETATTYSYSVIARDNSPNQNTTGWSDVNSATTDPWACTAPIDVDLSGDCLVNMIDFAILAAEWTHDLAAGQLIVNGGFDTGLAPWATVALSGATGTMTTSFDAIEGNPPGSALIEADTGSTGANNHRFYQVIPVTVGEEYVFSGDWAGDISGTVDTNPDARNWAEVFIGFTDTTTPDGADFGSIIYKKAYGNGNQHTSTGIWDWEPITASPASAPPGGVFTATAPYMCISFNLGGRANSGTTYFWVDNISVTGNLPCAEIDLNDDCQLNFQDLALLTDAWLECNRDPASECWQ